MVDDCNHKTSHEALKIGITKKEALKIGIQQLR